MDNSQQRDQEALEVAVEAGHILLENGAEISRIEETMERIATNFGVDSKSFYVIGNGIFSTGRNFANVTYIPFKGAQLDKVVAVNELSREIADMQYTAAQSRKRLEEIRAMPGKPKWQQVAGAAAGCAFFSILFGGGFDEGLASLLCGAILWCFILLVRRWKFSKMFGNICGGAIATLCSIIFWKMGLAVSLCHIIVGTVIALVPGVPFINGIRDIADEDYISGTARLLDALMVFFSIALGCSITFIIYGHLAGGFSTINNLTEVSPMTSNIVVQSLAAFLGTLGFSVLFGVPTKHYLSCSLVGMAGWASYVAITQYLGASPAEGTLCGTLAVALLARFCAVWRHCPATVFLLTGIFPMVPGGGIFWTSYYLVSHQFPLAFLSGFTAVKVAIALVLGIVLVSVIPNSFFHLSGARDRA